MPIIKPFNAVRYDQSRVSLEDVIAPPYDVISPAYQEKLYGRHENNVVRLILGREEDRYAAASAHLQEWLGSGILLRDQAAAIYVLHQKFATGDGHSVTRKGFIALCRLEEFDKKVVLPHERTLSKPREDRLKLFKATRSNFSQIFSLYRDADHTVDSRLNQTTKHEPVIDVTYEEVRNRVWAVTDQEIIAQVAAFMKDEQVLIADGHHRYETALAYRDARRNENPGHTGNELYNYVMMFFSNIEDDGLVIYPTHRVVHSLKDFDSKAFLNKLNESFIVREVSGNGSLQTGLNAATARAFGIVIQGETQTYLATLKPTLSARELVKDDIPEAVKELDVTLLHSVILRDILGISIAAQEAKMNLEYVKQVSDAVDATRTGAAQVSFILNPTKLHEVREVARAGHVMPQKSTYFYPKLVSGLLINVME